MKALTAELPKTPSLRLSCSAVPMRRQRRPNESSNVVATENAELTPRSPERESGRCLLCRRETNADTQRPMVPTKTMGWRSWGLRRHHHPGWGCTAVQMTRWQWPNESSNVVATENADLTPRIAHDRGVSGVINAQWFRAIGWKIHATELPVTPSRRRWVQ